jgi:hypothetical protein
VARGKRKFSVAAEKGLNHLLGSKGDPWARNARLLPNPFRSGIRRDGADVPAGDIESRGDTALSVAMHRWRLFGHAARVCMYCLQGNVL